SAARHLSRRQHRRHEVRLQGWSGLGRRDDAGRGSARRRRGGRRRRRTRGGGDDVSRLSEPHEDPARDPSAGGVDGPGRGIGAGVYDENLDFEGKAITVRSEAGPEATIVDGGGRGPVVKFASDEGPTSALEGFTLRNGAAAADLGYAGGGIYMHAASPRIARN